MDRYQIAEHLDILDHYSDEWRSDLQVLIDLALQQAHNNGYSAGFDDGAASQGSE